jgi:hypothetical protein
MMQNLTTICPCKKITTIFNFLPCRLLLVYHMIVVLLLLIDVTIELFSYTCKNIIMWVHLMHGIKKVVANYFKEAKKTFKN